MTDTFTPGQKVIYRPHPGATPEEGIVVRYGLHGVFVRYGNGDDAKLTPAELLEPIRR